MGSQVSCSWRKIRYWCIRCWLDIEVLSHCLGKRQVEGWETVTQDTSLQGGKGNAAFTPPRYGREFWLWWADQYQYQFSHSVLSDSLWPHELQHARLPCPSPTPGVSSNMSIKSVMPSDHLILGCPLFVPPSIFPSIRVPPVYSRGNSDSGKLIMASKDIQVLILEPVSVTFLWPKKTAHVIELRILRWEDCPGLSVCLLTQRLEWCSLKIGKGPQAQEYRWPLEVEIGKESNFSQNSP